jgi:hypothetical protein
MSSKEGTHTPVSTSSLDIEPGTLVRYCYLDEHGIKLGLIIDIHPSPYPRFDGDLTARILWSGAEHSSLCPIRDLVPCNE